MDSGIPDEGMSNGNGGEGRGVVLDDVSCEYYLRDRDRQPVQVDMATSRDEGED